MTMSHDGTSAIAANEGLLRLDQNHRRSRAIVSEGIAYLAGQVADDTALDIRGQASQALRKVDDMLALAGTHKGRILTAQVWLKSVKEDLSGFNEVWDGWVIPGFAPTRCCGQVELTDPAFRVEIVVTASVPR
jgi:enamine deaminase RidA (YjgF/YER057c/UK114 family)